MVKEMYEGIPKYCLQTLFKVSKRWDRLVQFNEFEVIDKSHVSLFRFEPIKEFPRLDVKFNAEWMPCSILNANNNIEIDKWVKAGENGKTIKYMSVKINGYNISGIRMLGDDEYKLNFRLDFDKENLVRIHTTGKFFKPLIETAESDDMLCYYRDDEVSNLSSFNALTMRLSYDVGEKGEKMLCTYPAYEIKKLKDIIPNGDIEICVGEDFPLGIIWFDTIGNKYTFAVAPRIEADDTRLNTYKDNFEIKEGESDGKV